MDFDRIFVRIWYTDTDKIGRKVRGEASSCGSF